MGECWTAKLRVDQRNNDANARQPQPYGHIFRPVRHHEADGFALGNGLIERPACIRVSALGNIAIGHVFANGKERWRVAAGLR